MANNNWNVIYTEIDDDPFLADAPGWIDIVYGTPADDLSSLTDADYEYIVLSVSDADTIYATEDMLVVRPGLDCDSST